MSCRRTNDKDGDGTVNYVLRAIMDVGLVGMWDGVYAGYLSVIDLWVI